MDIEKFKGKITQVAMANRYSINFGDITSKYFPTLGRDMEMLAKSVNAPGIEGKEVSTNYWGFERSMISSIDFDQVSISFLIDSEFNIRKGFERWYRDIFDRDNWTVSYFEEYAAKQVNIQVLNKQNNVVSNIMLYDVYPTNLGSLDLSYSNPEAAEFTMAFKFWNWKSLDL